MPGFDTSYLGKLRTKLGHELLLSPGVQVLLRRSDERILVQKRTDTGRWELPAGSCEPGESFRTAAVTELMEETGIRLDPQQLVPFASLSNPNIHILDYPNGDQVHAFALCFWAAVGNVVAAVNDGETTEYQWVMMSDVPEPVHPPTTAVLSLFERYLSSGLFQAD